MPHPILVPLVKWPEKHGWPSVGGLRHLVFHADRNGFRSVFRKAGGRILIEETAFFEWVERRDTLQGG